MMSQADFVQTLERVRAGDGEAWGALYREHVPGVFRLCRRALPTREDAEDATADIFLKVRLKLMQYDSNRPFRPWLYKLAANHCWDELRRRRRKTELPDPDTLSAGTPGPLAHLITQEEGRDVRAGLRKLGDRDRLVVVMRYYAELSYKEIADVLSVPPSLVGVLLLRARRRLRQILVEEGKA
jgi:RNA polymerase sigma-70 factor, ECF subfamily